MCCLVFLKELKELVQQMAVIIIVSELAFQNMLQGEYEIDFSCIVSLFVWLLTSSYDLVGLVVKESIL